MYKKLLLICLIPSLSLAQNIYKYPVPRDPTNTPVYGGLGLPFYSGVTVTAATYIVSATVPLTGNDIYRQYRSVYVYNPDTTRTVYACFGGSTACATDQMKINPGYGLIFDNVYYGYLNGITNIYLRLDSTGSVVVEVGGW